jgi:transaldolase
MITQGREMNTWIPNAHIKLPTTKAGLEAANVLTGEGVRVNMTLIFSQAQAAAVHAATLGAKKGDVFLSPFVGRLDDRGENGIDLISRISDMYKKEGSHVEILTASVRNIDHFLASIAAGTDIITCPKKILDEWAAGDFITPDATYEYTRDDLSSIPDASVSLTQSWQEYNIQHDLTDTGLQKFADDWNALIA